MEEINSVIHGMVTDYKCEKCGNTQKVNIFPCINFTQNPEYYALVKDLSIFRVKCEKCGDTKIIQFDTLLIDEQHKYFLYLLTDRSLYNKFQYQITYFIETVLNKDDKYDLTKYKTRLVFSPNDLVEKMNLFELGLDDEAIELIKYGIYEKKLVDRSVYDCLYFDGMNNADLEFIAFSSKTDTKKPMKFVVQSVFYNKVIDDLSNFKNRHRDYFEVIDRDWVVSKFENTSNKEV
jgi:ribosomal protein S27E